MSAPRTPRRWHPGYRIGLVLTGLIFLALILALVWYRLVS